MRRRQRNLLVSRRFNWRTWIATAAAVIGVASAGAWLIRDVGSLVRPSIPAEGSLIVNINTGTQSQLESIPGVGPTRAAQIIAFRPFDSVDDLVKISGIGQLTLENIRPFVTTEGDTRKR